MSTYIFLPRYATEFVWYERYVRTYPCWCRCSSTCTYGKLRPPRPSDVSSSGVSSRQLVCISDVTDSRLPSAEIPKAEKDMQCFFFKQFQNETKQLKQPTAKETSSTYRACSRCWCVACMLGFDWASTV